MNRTTLSLVVVAALLAAVTALGIVTRPEAGAAGGAGAARTVPVERTGVVCPAVAGVPGAQTTLTAFSPAAPGAAPGQAAVTDLADPAKSRLAAQEPGRTATATIDGDVPALTATAEGGLAPAFTVQTTSRTPAGPGRQIAGLTCPRPSTGDWFVGASTEQGRSAYLHLANSTDAPAAVDVELYGPDGPIPADSARGITLPPRTTQNLLLSTLAPPNVPVLAVHVVATSGRVASSVRDSASGGGGDWLPLAGTPARELVVPGVPADATQIQLVLFVPGETDTDVALEVAGKTTSFRPVGAETTTVRRGRTVVVDLTQVKGESFGIKLKAERTEILAGVRVTRGADATRDVAFLAAAPPVGPRAVLADNRVGGNWTSSLLLSAPAQAGKVRVTTTGGTGEPSVQDHDIAAGSTLDLPLPAPVGANGPFSLVVETLPGSGPVHAARLLGETVDKAPLFTVQPLVPAVETATLLQARSDLGVLAPR